MGALSSWVGGCCGRCLLSTVGCDTIHWSSHSFPKAELIKLLLSNERKEAANSVSCSAPPTQAKLSQWYSACSYSSSASSEILPQLKLQSALCADDRFNYIRQSSADECLSWFTVGNTTNVSLWIMGGYDSHSPPLLGISSSFPFHDIAQSHYKAIKGYELPRTPIYDREKALWLHRYSHIYIYIYVCVCVCV